MKRYLLFLLVFGLGTTTYAQYQYVPVPTSNAVWKVHNFQLWKAASICMKMQYGFTGKDTTIGSDTYYQLEVRKADTNSIPANCDVNTIFNTPVHSLPPAMYVWMVERHKKVYILNAPGLDTTKDKAYVDFSVGPSDIGRMYGPVNGDTIVSVDTITVNGTLRKRIVAHLFSSSPVNGVLDTLIEGIGSYRYGLGFPPLMQNGLDDVLRARLICFTVNNQAEYVYNNSACADIWPLSINNTDLDRAKFRVTPNPFYDRLTLNKIRGARVSVRDIIGNTVYTHTSATDVETVNTSTWPKGMYIVTIQRSDKSESYKLVKY